MKYKYINYILYIRGSNIKLDENCYRYIGNTYLSFNYDFLNYVKNQLKRLKTIEVKMKLMQNLINIEEETYSKNNLFWKVTESEYYLKYLGYKTIRNQLIKERLEIKNFIKNVQREWEKSKHTED